MNRLKRIIYVLLFPFYSIFSKRMGFSIFFRWQRQWRVWTRGVFIRVKEPRLWVLEYFRHFVPPKGGLVFDVGGELGYETCQFSELVGDKGRVIVFECLPDHVARLRKIAANCSNIVIVENACWNSRTTLDFFVGKTPGSNTAVPDAKGQVGQSLADTSREKLIVQADTLDNLWRLHAKGVAVDLLKMDIEGAEYEALEGAKEMLNKTSNVVVAAYHIRSGVRTAPTVARMLLDAGFTVRTDENFHVYATRKQ